MKRRISKKIFKGPFSLYNTIESDQCPSDLWKRPEPYQSFIKTFDGDFVEFTAWEDENYFYYTADKNLNKEFKYLFWFDYPLNDFYEKFSADLYISKLVKFGYGLRLMRDLDINYRIIEALITQNNNLKRIRKLDEILRNEFGNGYTYDLKKLADARISKLKAIGLGYRAEYIRGIAKAMLSKKLDIDKINAMPTNEARKYLMQFNGIGPKVADIILGFGLGRMDVFPADVWLKRAIAREYFNGKATEKQIRKFAIDYFGEHANIAHVYIYFYERRKDIKSSSNIITL